VEGTNDGKNSVEEAGPEEARLGDNGRVIAIFGIEG
jgi:hypothetical protein